MNHRLVFGSHRVTLFQRNDQPSNYWFMRVAIEGRQYKRSLQTCVLEVAKQKASDAMIEILAKQKAGQKVFATSLKEFRDAYLLELRARVTRKELSKLTATNTSNRIDGALAFLKDAGKPSTTALDSIEGKFWQNYIDYRFKQNAKLRRGTISWELSLIRAAYEWARKKQWVSEFNIPIWELTLEKEDSKRVKIAPQDFLKGRMLIRDWVLEGKTEKHRHNRYVVQAVFETIMVTGLRSGEILSLRRDDVQIGKDEIIFSVRDDTSKVRQSRQVPLLWSQATYFRTWLDSRTDLEPTDFIFGAKGTQEPRNMFYRHFGTLRKEMLERNGLSDLDLYHARHWAITNWLLAGHSIHLIAKLCGTSTKQIEKTYSNVIDLTIGREFSKQRLVYKDDGSYEIVERNLAI